MTASPPSRRGPTQLRPGLLATGESRESAAWAHVDLDALCANYRRAKQVGAGRRVISVVKADGYGHGSVSVARALVRAGTDALAVATLDEAIALRDAGLTLPVLIFQGPRSAPQAERMRRASLLPVVSRFEQLDLIEAVAARTSRRGLPIHVNLDTGMGRLGFQLDELGALIQRLRRSRHLVLDGVMTHLAESDDVTAQATPVQRERFRAALAQLGDRSLRPPWVHADPSAGILHGPTRGTTAIRPGIMLYGADPTCEGGAELVPVMSLCCRVIHAKRVPAGTRVGYGGTYVTAQATQILTLPIGYADGLPRAAGGRWSVAVRGRVLPLVGRVSMDLATVDAGPDAAFSVGTDVVVFGRVDGAVLPVERLASAVGTLAYEILVRIGPRVPRLIAEGGSA